VGGGDVGGVDWCFPDFWLVDELGRSVRLIWRRNGGEGEDPELAAGNSTPRGELKFARMCVSRFPAFNWTGEMSGVARMRDF
jgi:hypothetical protein